jgi:hypothetical protein
MPTQVTRRRQYERRAVDIVIQMTIGEECSGQVAPLHGSTFAGRLTDISGGGAYAVSPTFLPRGTRVALDLPPGTPVPAGRVWCSVVKTAMVDREPRFGVGLRFEDTECEVVRTLRDAAPEGGT